MGWLSGWQYRKSHVINSASGAGTNYQVRIVAHYGSGTDSGPDVYLNGKCRTDFGDIRFCGSDGVTLLSYWIEEKVDGDYAIIWVKVADDLSTNSATIYIYYGNPSATTTSNPDTTLIKYGGFEGGTLSPFNNVFGTDYFSVSSTVKKWGNYGAQANDQSSSQASGRYPSANTFWALNKVAIEFWMRTDATSTSGGGTSVYIAKNGYQRVFIGIQDNGVFVYWTGSSYTFGPASKGTWYKFVVELDFDNLKWNFRIYNTARELLYNYTNLSMGATSVSYSDVMMYSSVALVGLSYWDEFFSRKWVDPEPSHGSWGSEETAIYTTTLTNSLGLTSSFLVNAQYSRTFQETLFSAERFSFLWTALLTLDEFLSLGLSNYFILSTLKKELFIMLTTLGSKMKMLRSSVLTIADRLSMYSKKVIVSFLRLQDLHLTRYLRTMAEVLHLLGVIPYTKSFLLKHEFVSLGVFNEGGFDQNVFQTGDLIYFLVSTIKNEVISTSLILYLRRIKLVLETIGLQESISLLLNLIFLTLRERLSFFVKLSVPSAGLIAFVRLVFRTNYSAYLKWRQEYFVRAIKKVYEVVRKLSSNG